MELRWRCYLCRGPHCQARGAAAAYAALEAALWEARLLGQVELQVSSCQDHCDHGPNLLIHPGGWRYVGLDVQRIQAIVAAHLRDGTPLPEWLATPSMRRSNAS